jgi:hypothetical protein
MAAIIRRRPFQEIGDARIGTKTFMARYSSDAASPQATMIWRVILLPPFENRESSIRKFRHLPADFSALTERAVPSFCSWLASPGARRRSRTLDHRAVRCRGTGGGVDLPFVQALLAGIEQ